MEKRSTPNCFGLIPANKKHGRRNVKNDSWERDINKGAEFSSFGDVHYYECPSFGSSADCNGLVRMTHGIDTGQESG